MSVRRVALVALVVLVAGCAGTAPTEADRCVVEPASGTGPSRDEAGGGFRTLLRSGHPEDAIIEKWSILLTPSEYEEYCRNAHAGGAVELVSRLDARTERALIVHGHCVHGVAHFAAVNVTEVYATRCQGSSHAIAIDAGYGDVRLIDLEQRFARPHGAPTRDPPEPYDFDPALAVHLSRDTDGVLRRVDGGSSYVEGEWRPVPASPQEPLPACVPPTEASSSDTDSDKVFDDLEALLAATPQGERVSAIVAMRCPLAWNDVLALRGLVGEFPVNALWSTGAQAFAADLLPDQVRALAALAEIRHVEGNGIVSASAAGQ